MGNGKKYEQDENNKDEKDERRKNYVRKKNWMGTRQNGFDLTIFLEGQCEQED